jgi:hypothetical protein
MTSPSAFLYRYTPAWVGRVRIFSCRSMVPVDWMKPAEG